MVVPWSVVDGTVVVVPWSVVDGAVVAGCSVVAAGVIPSFEAWSPNQPLLQPIMANTITTPTAPQTIFLPCMSLSIVSSLALIAALIMHMVVRKLAFKITRHSGEFVGSISNRLMGVRGTDYTISGLYMQDNVSDTAAQTGSASAAP